MALPRITPSPYPREEGRTLFARIPDRLFTPLASPNRFRYWSLLCSMFENKFGPNAPLPPSHGYSMKEVLQDIEDELITQDVWESEDAETTPDTPVKIRAHWVFKRLAESGWFQTDRYGVDIKVTMRPAVRQFMTVLVSFAESKSVIVSGKIRSIDLLVNQVADGKAGGDVLREAAGQCRSLLESIRNTGSSIRDIMDELNSQVRTGEFVRRFCEDYIKNVFIHDYGQLRTREHPLSKRGQILRAVEVIHTSDQHRSRLIAWYKDNLCSGDLRRAEQEFERSISRLNELTKVDDYLEHLDDEIRRANRRAIAFLDYRLRSLRPIDHLIKQAVELAVEGKLPVIGDPFPPGDMISGERLSEPRKQIERAAPTELRRQQPSPEAIARSRVMLRAKERRSVTAAKLAGFVTEKLGTAERIASTSLNIMTLEDVRAYQELAKIGLAMSSGSDRLETSAMSRAKGFNVRLSARPEPEGSLITGKSFIIERRKPKNKIVTEKP